MGNPNSEKEKIRNVIYVSTGVVQNIAFREAGLEYLQQRGYTVTVWIVGGYDKTTKWDVFDKDCDLCEVYHLNTYGRYEKMVKEHCRDSVFILPTLSDKVLLHPICGYGCSYYIMGNRTRTPTAPGFEYDKSIKETFSERLSGWYERYRGRMLKFPFIRIKKSYIEWENRKYRSSHSDDLRPANLPKAVFVTNEIAAQAMRDTGLDIMDRCRVIYSNSRAYNDYLTEELKGEEISEDFILCANSGAGFYGSGVIKCYTVEDIYKPDENKKYLDQIAYMLDRLEDHYGMPVIVANHPRCDLRGYDYGGRKIVEGRTCELSKKCSLFVTATTTAIAYPVLYNKDILFYYNECIRDRTKFWGLAYEPLMRALDLNGLNLDDEKMINEPWNYITKIKPEVKDRYLETYHYEKGAINKIFGEVLYDALQEETL